LNEKIMIVLKEFVKDLLSLPGLSGYETPVRETIAKAWEPLVDKLSTSRLGSLHGLRRGSAPEPRPRIMLAAHMDAIGMMATQIKDGFIRFTEVGGIDPRILPGQPVTVHGRRDLPGIIIQPPGRLLPDAQPDSPVSMDKLLVDTGLKPAEVQKLVRTGDLISFAQKPIELLGNVIAGHSLDDRAAVAAVTVCLQELQHMVHPWDVWAVATSQEEETLGGAITSPFEIRPNIAIAIDVTFAKGPGLSDYQGISMGKGFALSHGPNSHPAIFKAMKELSERLDIPWQPEVYPAYSGTDAMSMQIVAEGIPTMVMGIPLRYMHTPVEAVSLKDIDRAGRLLAEFIARLEVEFLEKIIWE
jgi:tetrahedral aminopeptidase